MPGCVTSQYLLARGAGDGLPSHLLRPGRHPGRGHDTGGAKSPSGAASTTKRIYPSCLPFRIRARRLQPLVLHYLVLTEFRHAHGSLRSDRGLWNALDSRHPARESGQLPALGVLQSYVESNVCLPVRMLSAGSGCYLRGSIPSSAIQTARHLRWNVCIMWRHKITMLWNVCGRRRSPPPRWKIQCKSLLSLHSCIRFLARITAERYSV